MQILYILLTVLGFSCLSMQAEENFILLNGATKDVIKEFGSSVDERVTPACSFNIALSLMGYDTGVLQDEQAPKWDFQEGYEDYADSWVQSQTPQTWMTYSCVWYSKNIALQLGLEATQRYLSLFSYGNQDFIAGATRPAWISSSLKISPREQVDFIQKMIEGKLPISSHALQMTKNLLFKEEVSSGWKLFGKTGLGSTLDEKGNNIKVRWFVGWLESNDNFFPFAYLLQEPKVDTLQTVPRVIQLLEESNLWNLRERKMQKEMITLPEIKLVGITVRTNNKLEADNATGNIFPCVQKYFYQGLAEQIANRKKPGTTFCAYTDYETDHNGDYTYFIGEEVSDFQTELPQGFEKLTIPKQTYANFTTNPAPMPNVTLNAWY